MSPGMGFHDFLNLLASALGGWGAIYVLKSVALLSPDDMRRLAQTGYDFSSEQVHSIARQRADAIVGMGFVAAAFVLVFVTIAFFSGIEWVAPGPRWAAIVAVVALVAIAHALTVPLQRRLYNSGVRGIGMSLVRFYAEHHSSRGSLEDGFGTITRVAERFMDLRPEAGETPGDFVGRVLRASGAPAPVARE